MGTEQPQAFFASAGPAVAALCVLGIVALSSFFYGYFRGAKDAFRVAAEMSVGQQEEEEEEKEPPT